MGQDFILVGMRQTEGYLDYKGSCWYLILGDDARELFGAVQQDTNLLFLSAGIIFALAVVIAFLFSGRISKNVNELRSHN